MGAFQARIALPVEVRRELDRSQVFLSLEPGASGILRVTIVPAAERVSLVGADPYPGVFWLPYAAAAAAERAGPPGKTAGQVHHGGANNASGKS
jgi:hypothetical protein